MAHSILHDEVRLSLLADELRELDAAICNEENVPERFEGTLAGELAATDSELLARAQAVVFRLTLWARFPESARERYVRRLDVPAGPRPVA